MHHKPDVISDQNFLLSSHAKLAFKVYKTGVELNAI